MCWLLRIWWAYALISTLWMKWRLFASCVPDKRLTKFKGADKEKIRKSMLNIIKVCLDPSSNLPTFYALDASRLPPVGIDHVDVCAVLQELASLWQEVRLVSQLRHELDELKVTIKSLAEENQSLHYAQANNFVELSHDGARLSDNDFLPLPAGAASFKQSTQLIPQCDSCLLPPVVASRLLVWQKTLLVMLMHSKLYWENHVRNQLLAALP